MAITSRQCWHRLVIQGEVDMAAAWLQCRGDVIMGQRRVKSVQEIRGKVGAAVGQI